MKKDFREKDEKMINLQVRISMFQIIGTPLFATLDEENFASYFEYDAAGRVTATYKETRLGVKKISESQYNFGKQ